MTIEESDVRMQLGTMANMNKRETYTAGKNTLKTESMKNPETSKVEIVTAKLLEVSMATLTKPVTVHVTGRVDVETAAAVAKATTKLGLA